MLLVNDAGTIRCNGAKPRPLSDPLLLRARDLAGALGGDAKEQLKIAPRANSVYRYTIRLQDGTISFPDTAAASGKYPHLAQAEQFTVIKQEMFRLNAEFTGQSIERIVADSDRDRWFTAPEALEYGFVDHIITRAAHITGEAE